MQNRCRTCAQVHQNLFIVSSSTSWQKEKNIPPSTLRSWDTPEVVRRDQKMLPGVFFFRINIDWFRFLMSLCQGVWNNPNITTAHGPIISRPTQATLKKPKLANRWCRCSGGPFRRECCGNFWSLGFHKVGTPGAGDLGAMSFRKNPLCWDA